MNRRDKKRQPRILLPSFYPLGKVKRLVRAGKVLLRKNSLVGAKEAFGWEKADVLDALLKLKPRHFDKSDAHMSIPGLTLDFYKARGLKGENVYTHFYIAPDTGTLIVSSFKEAWV